MKRIKPEIGNPVKIGNCPATVIPIPPFRASGEGGKYSGHEKPLIPHKREWEGGRNRISQETDPRQKTFEGRQTFV
jgi:hypothetical protein